MYVVFIAGTDANKCVNCYVLLDLAAAPQIPFLSPVPFMDVGGQNHFLLTFKQKCMHP